MCPINFNKKTIEQNIYNKISPKITKVDMKLSHDNMIINLPYCKNKRKAYILMQKSAWFHKTIGTWDTSSPWK